MTDRKRILIVEDETLIAMLLEEMIQDMGYKVSGTAQSLALAQAAAHSTYDMAILDVQLNGISGIEVRYRLIDAGISLPVIYITANDSDAVRAAAVESGCIAYLTKPFSAQSLIEPIARVAAGRVH